MVGLDGHRDSAAVSRGRWMSDKWMSDKWMSDKWMSDK